MIRIKYSCTGCAIDQMELDVPARRDEDVIAWMEQTSIVVSSHHRAHSPRCMSQVCDLMIPFAEGNQKVGGLPVMPVVH